MKTRKFDDMLAEFDAKRPDLAATRPERVRQLLKKHDEYQSLLGGLRRANRKTQAEVAASLGVSQPRISELEKSRDLYLSTFADYVRAIGGELEFVIRFPEREISIPAEEIWGRPSVEQAVEEPLPVAAG